MFKIFIVLLLGLQGAFSSPLPQPADLQTDRCVWRLFWGCLPFINDPHRVGNEQVLEIRVNANGNNANAHDNTLTATSLLSTHGQHRITVDTSFQFHGNAEMRVDFAVGDRNFGPAGGQRMDIHHQSASYTFSNEDFASLLHSSGTNGEYITVKIKYVIDQGL